MKSIEVKFWGVRGSIPTPGPTTVRYGGNTPCVSLQFRDGPLFILDAGSGIRELGNELLQRKEPVSAYIFISHFHWDHIQGLPFFRPAHQIENTFTILGSDDTSLRLDQIIAFQMDPTYFPIAIQDMKAKIRFRSIQEETFYIEGVEIRAIYLNHPGYALGYRMTYKGKSVVYISDNELSPFNKPRKQINKINPNPDNLTDMFESFIENKEEHIINFCHNADILIHDSQFFIEEYLDKISWGHSPFTFTVDLAIKSRVKKLILFHHDPNHNDDAIDSMQELSREIIKESGASISCHAAREGVIINI